MAELIAGRAFNLLLGSMRIDHMAAISDDDDLFNPQLTTARDRNCGASSCNRAMALNSGNAHALALGQISTIIRLFFEGFEHQLPIGLIFGHFNTPIERIPATGQSHFISKDFGDEARLIGARTAMGRAWNMRIKVVTLVMPQRDFVRHIVNAIIGGGGTNLVLLVLCVPERTCEDGFGQAFVANRSGHACSRHGALFILRHIFLTRPEHFHRALEPLGNFRCLTSHGCAATAIAAKAATQEDRMGIDIFGISAELISNNQHSG